MDRLALARIDGLLAQLPRLHCKGLCQDCCCPPIGSKAEVERIRAAADCRAVKSGYCPLLDENGRCAQYELRPAICRLWGITEGMECPHGCKPDRYLTRDEAADIQQETFDLGGDFTPLVRLP